MKFAKRILALALAAVLVLSASAALAETLTVAVPNDPTNEGRALLLLQTLGILKLKDGVGLEATKLDIESTTADIEIIEVEASVLPEYKISKDVDYVIINNNFAMDAGLNPLQDSLFIEDANSPYVNVVSVKEGNAESDAAKALAAALNSKQVADFINATYAGNAVSTVTEVTDGYDASVDYEALKAEVESWPDKAITIAATPVPHEEVLNSVVAGILAEKGITLKVIEVTDYVTPNEMVEAGDVFANYFAHQPYQDSFNSENGTHLVTIAGIHVEPMALYGGKQETLDALKAAE